MPSRRWLGQNRTKEEVTRKCLNETDKHLVSFECAYTTWRRPSSPCHLGRHSSSVQVRGGDTNSKYTNVLLIHEIGSCRARSRNVNHAPVLLFVSTYGLSLCLYTKESQKHKQYGVAQQPRRRFPGMSVTSFRVVLEVSLAFDEQD